MIIPTDFYRRLVPMAVAILWMWFAVALAELPLRNGSVTLNIPSCTLWVFDGPTLVKAYRVAVGAKDTPTPVGRFTVLRKVVDPEADGADDSAPPLGSRWIGFLEKDGGEYGIHGIPDTSPLGQFHTRGSVQMAMKDVEEFFDYVDVGTPITITYALVQVARGNQGEILATVFPDTMGKGQPTQAQIEQLIRTQFPQARIDTHRLKQAMATPQAKPVIIGTW